MSVAVLGVALAAGLAAALAVPPPPVGPLGDRGTPHPSVVDPLPETDSDAGLALWARVLVGLSAGLVLWQLLDGAVGAIAGVAVGIWFTRAAAGVGTGRARARREAALADLPALVGLFAAGLRAGAPTATALDRACAALPGAAADRLGPVRARLRLGVPPRTVWSDLASDEVLAPLGRALARAQRTGAPVATVVEDLATELGTLARSGVEDRARTVGVRAALPLGLCLLPGFLLLGIVPLVAALVSGLVW